LHQSLKILNIAQIQKINDLREQAETMMTVDPANALHSLEEAFMLLTREPDSERTLAECGLQLATVYHKRKEELKALKIVTQCLNEKSIAEHAKLSIPLHEFAAEIYSGLGQHDKALEHLLKIAASYTSVKDKSKLGHVLNKIGETHKMLSEYAEAIAQHEKALKIFEELDNKEQVSVSNYYIGNCYNWADELDIAYNYLIKGLKTAEKLRSPDLKIKPLGSLAILFTKQKDYEKALDYFFDAIDNCSLVENVSLKSDLLKSLGNLYNQMGRYNDAIRVLLEAGEICKQLNLKQPYHLVNKFLSDSYEAIGQHNKALEYFKAYHQLSREIQGETVSLKTKGLQLKYNLEETERQKMLAEQSLLLKDTFLANVSHEFRTPLNGILGMANLLNDANLPDEQKQYLATIRNSAYQLVYIVDDILDYARLNTGQVVSSQHVANLNHAITETIKKLAERYPEKIVETDTDFKKEEEELIFDDSLFRKIIYNILFFGSAFSSNDKLNLAIYHSQNKLFANIRFNIHSKKSFPKDEEFFELNNPHFTQAGLNGYGLGLSLINAKTFTQIAGGKISVKLESMKCNFVVELPYKLTPSVKKQEEKSHKQLKTVAFILLVEDNKINQFLARTMLQKGGHTVELASDGEEALSKLKEQQYDIIITDVQMPGMDGYELTTQIRTAFPSPLCNIPVIALTAYESTAEKEKAKAAGMTDFLTKPYLPEQLNDMIAKHLNQDSEKLPLFEFDIEEIFDNLLALMAGDRKEASNLIGMFKNQFPELLNDMNNSVQAGDAKSLYKAAHKIKPNLMLFKNNLLTHLIEKIEKKAKDGKLNFELTQSVKELTAMTQQIVNELGK
jgi:CheY-like chemotaxis protein/HPt (histidine-containing phosphotransfer) domain-containing protein